MVAAVKLSGWLDKMSEQWLMGDLIVVLVLNTPASSGVDKVEDKYKYKT